jgi:hypothetical protein
MQPYNVQKNFLIFQNCLDEVKRMNLFHTFKQVVVIKKRAQQSVHLTGGILRHFRVLSTLKQNPALEVLSTPDHPQVTQTVRRQTEIREMDQ